MSVEQEFKGPLYGSKGNDYARTKNGEVPQHGQGRGTLLAYFG